MLRIGICDDVYDARLVLGPLWSGFWKNGMWRAVFEFSSGEGLLRWLESHAGELDLVFLDMEMGELDGMETARRLRALDVGLQLVFVTGYADHVFDGYSVGALGYLLKPPGAEQLEEVLDRAQGRCTGTWTGPTSAAAVTPTTAFLSAVFLILSLTEAVVTCVTPGRNTPFTASWMPWRRNGGGVCPHPPAVSGSGRSCRPGGGRRGGAAGRSPASCQPLLPAGGTAGLTRVELEDEEWDTCFGCSGSMAAIFCP